MVIYVTKDKEGEQRFTNWNEVEDYAKERAIDDKREDDLNKEFTKDMIIALTPQE